MELALRQEKQDLRYRISQLKIDPREMALKSRDALIRKALRGEIRRRTRTDDPEIHNIEIIRESIDARKKPDVRLVYTVDFDVDRKLPFDRAEREEYRVPKPRSETMERMAENRPVIVGFGPCGMFAALILAEAGLEPIVIERGKDIAERVSDVERFWEQQSNQSRDMSDAAAPDPDSNVQFGEGGAGTFSDGKLTTGIKDIRIRKVLKEFVEAGADPEILYKQRPHIGTDKLREIIPEIRRKIERLGGEVRFGARFEDAAFENGRVSSIQVRNLKSDATPNDVRNIRTDCIVLAIGHSARDTFRMLYERGFRMEQKPFSIGVRIEHPQDMINESQYGDPDLAKILGPADYKLSYRCAEKEGETRGRGVYTFCMCPGGQVINASTEPGTSVTNGMSLSGRDGTYANSGLLVDVRTEDFADEHPLAGMAFQKKYEELAWRNRTEDGMARTTYGSFRRGSDPVRNSIPAFASEAILEAMPVFGKKVRGFDRDDARMTAVESRSSSPVRVIRDEEMQTPGFRGVIPAGEGPGYAGGIMSAAVDGIRAAEKIIVGL